MSIGVITNMSSLNTQRSLMGTQNSLQTAMARLSSGYRINSAKDDAAGLGISDRMTAQITGMNQAIRNANDGISLAQTAEGAMQESTTILQRIRVLSVQSANDTNTAADRTALNDEVQQLLAEMQRISQTTQFNGQNIIDGTYTGSQFQVGANSAQTIMVNVGNVQTSALGSYQATGVLKVTGTALAAGDLAINGVAVSATVDGSAESIMQAINGVSNDSGVVATAETTLTSANTLLRNQSLQSGDLIINGINVGGVAGSNNIATQGANVAAAINAVSNQTGVTAEANVVTGALTLTSNTGKTIAVTTANSTNGANRVENASGLELRGAITAPAQSVSAVTFAAGTAPVAQMTFNADTADDQDGQTFTLNGVTFELDSNASVTAGNTAITYTTGDTATVIAAAAVAAINANTTATKNITASNAAGVLSITSNVATTTTTHIALTNVSALLSGSVNNAQTAGVGVAIGDTVNVGGVTYEFVLPEGGAASGSNVAVALGTSATLTAQAFLGAVNNEYALKHTNIQASGAAAVITLTSDLLGAVGDASVTVTEPVSAGTAATVTSVLTSANSGTYAALTTYGQLSLDSDKTFVLSGNNLAKAGLAAVSPALAAINTIDITTVDGANQAIKLSDGALSQLDSARSYLGAMQNRFESVIKNLSSTSENLSAARSRIQDADFAAETAQSSKMQILQQSGIAMLVQSNQVQQLVLSLLR